MELNVNYFIIDGFIKTIYETQVFGASFEKREFIIETESEDKQELKFEFTNQTGIDSLDNYVEGENVTVAFQLRGNEYKGKHYVNLKAIAIGEKKMVEESGVKVKKVSSKPVKLRIVKK